MHAAQGKFSHPASNGIFQRHGLKKKKEGGEEKETNIELLQRVFFFLKQDMFIKQTLFSPTYSKTSD